MRDAQIAQALKSTPWGNWIATPIAGDASSRRYSRLTKHDQPPVIVMDDPALHTTKFAEIANFLTSINLSAPQILHHNPTIGLMIIDDLGQTDFASHLRKTPDDETTLYAAATQVLSKLHFETTPIALGKIDDTTAPEMIDLAALHYAQKPAHINQLHNAMQNAFRAHVDPTPHIALRDFHAENLIWRADKTNYDRVGLLDFQDACLAPAGYDLMSLLRDARRDVNPHVATNCISLFCSNINVDPLAISAHLACISAQRNLRILGIFARLAHQENKLKYVTLLPRVWTHLTTDLAHPALHDLRQTVAATLPPPNAETLQRLHS